MGAVNYFTSKYITLGIKPYDFDDIKAGMVEEFGEDEEITDADVYDTIHSYYDADWENAESTLSKNDFEYFDLELKPGYYEGFTLDISPKFDFYSEEDRQEALKELPKLKDTLDYLAGCGMVACSPGWVSGYLDYKGTLEKIKEAIEEIKQDIEKEELYESVSVVKERVVPKRPYKYNVSYTRNDGDKVKNQLHTAENMTKLLTDLEDWEATQIVVKSIDDWKESVIKEGKNGRKYYKLSYTTSSGDKVKDQMYTAEYITQTLQNLEEWGATNIMIVSVDN